MTTEIGAPVAVPIPVCDDDSSFVGLDRAHVDVSVFPNKHIDERLDSNALR